MKNLRLKFSDIEIKKTIGQGGMGQVSYGLWGVSHGFQACQCVTKSALLVMECIVQCSGHAVL